MPFGYEITTAFAIVVGLLTLPRVCEAKASIEGLVWAVRGQGHRGRTCDVNEEGIEPTSIRSGVKTALHCQAICERRGDCVATDFLHKTQMCLLYDEACLEPQGGGESDGSEVDSFMLVRQFHFQPVSETAACEENNEGITPFSSRENLMSLEHCFLSCQHRSGCAAVDWFLETGICNFYHAPCNKPLSMQPGASSYRITHITGGQTIWEMKQRAIKARKKRQSWALTDANKACRKNSEGIKSYRFMNAANGQECRQQCNDAFLCEAVDYIAPSRMCILYEEPCFLPQDDENGAESWHVEAMAVNNLQRTDALNWKVISPNRGCKKNKEGVKEYREYLVRNFHECEHRCEAHKPCLAFDYYRRTKMCVLFNEQCRFPLQTGKGASSYTVKREVAPDWGKLTKKEQDEIIMQDGSRAGVLVDDEPIEAEYDGGTRPSVTQAAVKLLNVKPKELEKGIVLAIMREDVDSLNKLIFNTYGDHITIPRDTLESLTVLGKRYNKTKSVQFIEQNFLGFLDNAMGFVVESVMKDDVEELASQLTMYPTLLHMNANPKEASLAASPLEATPALPSTLLDIARANKKEKCVKWLEQEGHTNKDWLDEEDKWHNLFDDVEARFAQLARFNEIANEEQQELEWNRINKEIFGVDPSKVEAEEFQKSYKKAAPDYQEVTKNQFQSMTKNGESHWQRKFHASTKGNGTHIMNLSPSDEMKFLDIWNRFSLHAEAAPFPTQVIRKEGFFALIRATNPDGEWPPESWFNDQSWHDACELLHADPNHGITKDQFYNSYLYGERDQHSVSEDWQIIFENPKNEEQYSAINEPGSTVCPENIYHAEEPDQESCENKCTEMHECEYFQYSTELKQCRLSATTTCDDHDRYRSSRHIWGAIFKKPSDYHRWGGKRDPEEKMYHDELGDKALESSLEPKAVQKLLQDMRDKKAMAEGTRLAKILNDPEKLDPYRSEFIFMGPGHCEDPNNHHIPALGLHLKFEEEDWEFLPDVLHECIAYCVFRADCMGLSFRVKNNWCLLFVPEYHEDGWTIDLYGRGQSHEKHFRGYPGPSFGPISTTDTRPGWECYAKAISDSYRHEVEFAKERHEEKMKFEREMADVRKMTKKVLKNKWATQHIEDDDGAFVVKKDHSGNAQIVEAPKPFLRREAEKAEEAVLDEQLGKALNDGEASTESSTTTVNMMALAAKALQKKKLIASKKGTKDPTEYTSWGRGLGEI